MILTEETLKPLQEKDGFYPMVAVLVFQDRFGKNTWKTRMLGKTLPDDVYNALVDYVKKRA